MGNFIDNGLNENNLMKMSKVRKKLGSAYRFAH